MVALTHVPAGLLEIANRPECSLSLDRIAGIPTPNRATDPDIAERSIPRPLSRIVKCTTACDRSIATSKRFASA